MRVMRVLFVEDEEPQLDRFRTAAEDWNREQEETGRRFLWVECSDAAAAEEALRTQRFDCALFDLRLPKGTIGKSTEPIGSELALNTLTRLGIPVGIISADLSVLDPKLQEYRQVRQFRKGAIERGDGSKDAYAQVIDWFAAQWEMMEVLSSARSTMEQAGAEIFLQRIWPRWEKLEALERGDNKALTGIVTRQYVTHLADLLGIDSPDGTTWHPFENYVSPALLTDRAHTGDILDVEGTLWIVLTPQCDMATGKVAHILLAKCRPGIEKWAENIAFLKDADASGASKEKARRALSSLVNQNVPSSHHFLPPLPDTSEPLTVLFGELTTLSREEITARLGDRKASVATPFLSNLVQRFGAYVSRTGQPNIDIARLS